MNIYGKLLKARIELQNRNLKQTGDNKFAGYKYYELGDFLPSINQLFYDNLLCSIITFDKDVATMTITNVEKPEETLTFTSPMATAELKGCHAIQNLGAVETYSRRYLYMAALEIVEHDALDATTGKSDTEKPKGNNTQPNKTEPPKTNSTDKGQPSNLEKRATAIYFRCTGNKEGQLNMSKEAYTQMLKDYKESGKITNTFGKKWTLEDVEFIEKEIEEQSGLPL